MRKDWPVNRQACLTEVTAGKAGPIAGSGNDITLAATEFEVPVENAGDGVDTRKLLCGRHLHAASGGCIEVLQHYGFDGAGLLCVAKIRVGQRINNLQRPVN